LTSAAASSSSSSIAFTNIKARSSTISNYSDTNHCQCLLKSTFNAHSIAANSYSPTTDKERKKDYMHLSSLLLYLVLLLLLLLLLVSPVDLKSS
jgi:hypothetical protein